MLNMRNVRPEKVNCIVIYILLNVAIVTSLQKKILNKYRKKQQT